MTPTVLIKMTLQHPHAFLLWSFLLFTVTAETGGTLISETCPPQGPAPVCAIEGQPDLYGFGVRFGIYGVWIASWIANNYVIEEYDGALDSNSIFLLAIGIAVALNSSSSHIRLVDGLILGQLAFGFLSSVMTVWGYRTAVYRREGARGALRFGGLGTHVRLFLVDALTGFNIYFWSRGISRDFPSCNRREECDGIRVFFFGSQPLLSGARTFYLVVAGFCCVHYLCLSFSWLAWLVTDWLGQKDPVWNLQEQRRRYQCLTLRE